jgi:UDP-3-O-[3-hydroxymyristoyl] N-acetylglucosamine deacetylase
VAFEQTIQKPVACSGIGLHSGAPVNLRIVPAPAGRGIIFRRTDLDDFEIEAIGRNVAKVSYATSLMKQGVLISTTEHLLSAFIGIGVDNAYVELDNLELPILDGSAKPFVDMVRSAGLKPQRKKRTYMRIRETVEVRDGDKFIGVYPVSDDELSYSIDYDIDFPAPIGKSALQIDLIGSGSARVVAGVPARDDSRNANPLTTHRSPLCSLTSTQSTSLPPVPSATCMKPTNSAAWD